MLLLLLYFFIIITSGVDDTDFKDSSNTTDADAAAVPAAAEPCHHQSVCLFDFCCEKKSPFPSFKHTVIRMEIPPKTIRKSVTTKCLYDWCEVNVLIAFAYVA